MKSQVNSLLHVLRGILKDVQSAYPALEEELSKDFGRLTLYCQQRGEGVFLLDLPHLESLLLAGLESGRLELKGPLSQRVSKRTQVPRLFSGLWLRIFDRHANLKQDVDVTALFMLRQLLVSGKRIEVECTYHRKRAVVGAYHDIERKLRCPSLGWASDSLVDSGCGDCIDNNASQCHDPLDSPSLPILDGESEEERIVDPNIDKDVVSDRLDKLHLVQALDGLTEDKLPLWRGLSKDQSVGSSQAQRLSDQRLLYQIQRVADLVIGSFDILDPLLYSEQLEQEGLGIGFRHGPGAVAERLKSWEKSQFPNWPHKLQNIFPYETCGKTIGSPADRPENHEVASRLLAVPKTAKGPRLIAAEPTAHQWCQQLVLRFLFDQTRKSYALSGLINFKDQSLSGDLVLKASLDRKLATVDLSDASDRLSCWTVERMFRRSPSILFALHAARTRYIRDEVTDDVDYLKLRKFASQGTATTFPVMSIVMCIIAIASAIRGPVTLQAIRKLRNQVRVFGDDIILPTHGYVRLLRAMDLLQLKVNVAKSYINGHFRESCGVDGYLGYDVTPVKPRTLDADSPASCQAVVDNSNNLFLKGLWNASTAMLDLLPARLRRGIRIVGRNDAGFRGLTSFTGSDESHLIKRWNSRFHRDEVRVWTLSIQTQKRPRDGFSAFLDFIAREHSSEHARTVSEFAAIRKTRIGLQWEPRNTGARHNAE